MTLTDDQPLYIGALGKAVLVTAIFVSDEDTNAYLDKQPDESVIAQYGPFIFVARKDDQGKSVEPATGRKA